MPANLATPPSASAQNPFVQPRRVVRRAPAWDGALAPYRLHEHAWGYRVGPRGGEGLPMATLRHVGMGLGAAMLAVGVALLIPLMLPETDAAWAIRLGLGALLAAGGATLMWGATRGSQVVIEVDCMNGALRRIVPHHIGAPTILSSHPFAEVAGVAVGRARGLKGLAVLAVLLESGEEVAVAAGPETALAPLRRRLMSDLMLRAQPRAAAAPSAAMSLRRAA